MGMVEVTIIIARMYRNDLDYKKSESYSQLILVNKFEFYINFKYKYKMYSYYSFRIFQFVQSEEIGKKRSAIFMFLRSTKVSKSLTL